MPFIFPFSGDRMLFILILHLIIYSHNSSFCFHVFFYDYFQLTTSSTTHQSQNKIFRATCNDGHDKERDVVSFFNFMSSRRKQTLTLDFSVSSKMSVNVRSKSTNRGQKFFVRKLAFSVSVAIVHLSMDSLTQIHSHCLQNPNNRLLRWPKSCHH